MIPITKPFFDENEERAAAEAIRSGWVVQGPRTIEFEKMVAERVGAKYALATSNCTTALHLALIALGIGPGDEVLVPSYSFIATANSVLHAGATPVFVDIDARTYNMDPLRIEEKITPRTRAIMPVHQIGLAADIDTIHAIARKHDLLVLEDAATIIGGTYKGKPIGAHSRAVCFSFHPRKAITTGEGGMVTTNDENIARQVEMLRSHGANVSDFARHTAGKVVIEEYPVLGYNYRLTDIQGAVGVEQMKKLDWILQRRLEIGERYNQAFADLDFIETPYEPAFAKHTYQSYCVRIAHNAPKTRDEIMAAMQDAGIATRRGVMAAHLEPFYVNQYGRVSLPVTEQATRTTMLLPIYAQMTEQEIGTVIHTFRKIVIR
ncbi:MAG: DegT/DnrJ/EryC1/StrS family aminotransferase [Chloroflexi bacterium]|nr:DegT/DnrJ/EryC1/StrS family aminotransferase [Chloroflexota bacterium]